MFSTLLLVTIGQLSQVKESLQTDTLHKLPQPAISIASSRDFEKGEDTRIECRCPGLYTGSTFYLNRYGQSTYDAQQTVSLNEDTATFNFHNLSARHQGKYQCFYRKNISGRWATSKLSSPVEIIVRDEAAEEDHSKPGTLRVTIWGLILIVTGGVLLVLMFIAVVWCTCRKIANARRNRNDRDNLWTTLDGNIISPHRASDRRSFRFSRDLETPRDHEGESPYYANQSTEFLNDTQHSPTGLHTKPYFITFMEQ